MKILNSKSVVISAVLALAAFGCERKPKVESSEPSTSGANVPVDNSQEGVGGSGGAYAPPTADPSRPQDMPDNNTGISGQSAPPSGTESGSGSSGSTMGTGTGTQPGTTGSPNETPPPPPNSGSMGTGNGAYDSTTDGTGGSGSGSGPYETTPGTGGSSDAGR